MATKKKQTVVLYPFPGVGHIVPMVQLAKVFLRHGYHVTIVLIEPPSGLPGFGAGDVARSNPSISFHVLPRIPDPVESAGNKPPFLVMLELMRRYNDELQEFLLSIILRQQHLHSLVTSMFTAHAVDVAAKLRVPVYTFFASPAAVLAVVTQLPALLAGRTSGLKELGETPLEFLGVPPFPASHIMPEVLEHPEEEFCKAIVEVWKRNTDTDGVLVNTFESLETRAVQALRDPHQCVLPGRVMPPIYCVGPLVNGGKDQQAESKLASSITIRHECLEWLDAQPERSVVFLCFGSRGVLSLEQIWEIAAGLDNSGHRFLWTVRKPAGESEKDLHDILGFLERTKGRGIVVESWAPQMDVLRHPSTGAFVTHCGWNSTLEAITAGVPVLCWPLYAEQMLNKVLITEEMGIGVEMKGYKAGFITAEEVEAKVRLVLESEEGGELRKRIAARKKEAEMALKDGGSSQVAFAKFLSDVNNLREHEQIGIERICAPSLSV
ncbi:hypothetical protein PR202_gb16913 [Eleusine coracana subsp. coracana]|uniref:Glycosyltransferase n=1 Tax=Eleusine coracana subsp. coracana TaxID=191504 RepID=A0AAV5F1M3_ELECO|nr:hypothetical protein QOZ80_6BG0473730 [Eleusine coracana subsp. coracana]GJN28751.1 hypothetical protein PR202_gb16913 [Eleusine coracana subsp. coracana]